MVSSLIQVKAVQVVLNKSKAETISDVIELLLNIIKKFPTLAEKIALCNYCNKALQDVYDNILNRGEVTKEKIKNAVVKRHMGSRSFTRGIISVHDKYYEPLRSFG